jgi:diguanylate cyclase (GGDEF)-like protein/PAS domain S-box-containing protein
VCPAHAPRDALTVHPYLRQQLQRCVGAKPIAPDLLPVLEAVSTVLDTVDRERELGAAAVDELSRELQERYERLQQSEQRYRLLFDESPLAMFAVRRSDGVVLAWNLEAEGLFGYQATEALHRSVDALGLFAHDDEILAPGLSAGQPLPQIGQPQECSLYARDGRRILAVVILQLVMLDGSEAAIVHVRDVTVERESLRAQAESEARFRAFFDHAGLAIHVLSAEGIMLEANPAYTALLGFDPQELVGRAFSLLSPEEDLDACREVSRDLLSGLRDAATMERRFFHKDGHLVWGQLTVSVVRHGAEMRLIGMIQDITERKRMEGQLLKQAFQDELSGLANRVLFRDRLRHALERRSRSGNTVAVILLDLDGFKRVNDSLGHAVGDELLQVIGRRIASTVRTGDTVARLGGDEFAVVIESVEHDSEPDTLADRLLFLLRLPIRVGGREVAVGVSFGIAVAEPADDEEAVLRNADTAMYAAKASGKGCVRRFDPSMHLHAMEWLELELDLRLAVDRREFQLEFQPQVRIASGHVKGFEALLRWQHPTRGHVLPGSFLPVAEETGIVVAIGRWVLGEACRQAVRWADSDGHLPSVSVNIAARQLDSDSLVSDTRHALLASGLDPQRLVLEITETDVMRAPEDALRKLQALKALGVRLAIDDFGTGYSSLSHLQYFPVDELKIDRSFVMRIERGDRDAAFVRTIVALAKSLSVEVVAEGIEERLQHDYLEAIGCDSGQGYLYSRPLNPDHAARYIVEGCRLPSSRAGITPQVVP